MSWPNWLDRILFDADPSGIFLLAFVVAVVLLTIGRVVWRLIYLFCSLAFELFRAALHGRRERLERERAERDARRRIAANLIAAQARRARTEARS